MWCDNDHIKRNAINLLWSGMWENASRSKNWNWKISYNYSIHRFFLCVINYSFRKALQAEKECTNAINWIKLICIQSQTKGKILFLAVTHSNQTQRTNAQWQRINEKKIVWLQLTSTFVLQWVHFISRLFTTAETRSIFFGIDKLYNQF